MKPQSYAPPMVAALPPGMAVLSSYFDMAEHEKPLPVLLHQ